MDVFIRAFPEARNAALHNSAHKNDNAEIVFQEMRLGIIINFIAYRSSVGRPEKVGTLAGSEPAGAAGGAGPAAREPAGQYNQAFCTRRMQAEDMKNTKLFLQYGPLSAATIEKFDQWRDDIMRAARSVNLTEPAHWATINRFMGTCMENNIYQTVVDLILKGIAR